MEWDFYTFKVIPEMFEPLMNCAFATLFIAGAFLWLRFMRWTLKK